MTPQLKERFVGAVVLAAVGMLAVAWLLSRAPGAPPSSAERVPVSVAPAPRPPVEHPAPVVVVEPSRPSAPSPAPRPAPRPQAVEAPVSGTPATRGGPAPSSTGRWAIQLASFAQADNAAALRDRVQALGHRAAVSRSGTHHRVVVGPLASEQQARSVAAALTLATGLIGVVRQSAEQ